MRPVHAPAETASGWEGILDPGETILWQGRPDTRIVFDATTIIMGVAGAAFAGFALFWMVMAAQGGGYFWIFGLIHFSVGFGIMLWGPLGQPFIRARTWYTLTDRRAFIATNLPLTGRKLHTYPIGPTTPITFQEDGERATIHFATQQRRTRRGLRNEDVGFERISDGRAVLSLIRQVQARSLPAPHDTAARTTPLPPVSDDRGPRP